MNVLYLSYDGMTDPLGRSQVLPYLVGLSARGHQITLVSFEKPERIAADAEHVRDICRGAGIAWHPLRYHKRPPILSSMFDVRAMKRLATLLNRRERFDLVHCRSYMAAIAGHHLKTRFGVPFLFDMRGFWADERIERGFWPRDNPLFRAAYRYFKRLERGFFHDADAVVSLTQNARVEVEGWPVESRPQGLVSVIPCCVDLDLFNPANGRLRAATRTRLGLDDRTRVLVYVGSIGGAYLVEEMFALFRAYRGRHPGAKFMFVSGHERSEIETAARRNGVEPGEIIVVGGRRDEVPALIAAADLGACFITRSFAAIASCPTKFGEMLAMGVPVIANGGIGDVAEIIRDTGAGAVVEQFEDGTLSGAVEQVEEAKLTLERVREAAVRWFALEDGIERYDAIYRVIGAKAA